jgi:hypothetical protein
MNMIALWLPSGERTDLTVLLLHNGPEQAARHRSDGKTAAGFRINQGYPIAPTRQRQLPTNSRHAGLDPASEAASAA